MSLLVVQDWNCVPHNISSVKVIMETLQPTHHSTFLSPHRGVGYWRGKVVVGSGGRFG